MVNLHYDGFEQEAVEQYSFFLHASCANNIPRKYSTASANCKATVSVFTLLLSISLLNTQNSFKIIVLYVAMMAICLGLATLDSPMPYLRQKKIFRESNHDALYRLQSPVKASHGFSPARSLLRHRPKNFLPQTPFGTFPSSFSVSPPSHQAGHSGREWVIQVDLISVQE